jgi:hypothetical protein
VATPLRRFTTWLGRKNGQRTDGYRWFQLWIAIGIVLAILLLVSSISTYVLVSRRLLVDHIRGDLASQVAMLDQQVQRGAVQHPAEFAAMLRQTQDRSNGRITWLQIRNGDGGSVAQAGAPATPAFSRSVSRER